MLVATNTPLPPEPTPQATAAPSPEPTSPRAESSPTPARRTGKSEADALWVSTDGPATDNSHVVVDIEPNDNSQMRVGFFEDEVLGTGDMWQSSGWIAVVLSTLLLGHDPGDYEVSSSVLGRIDGPSAGGLMTVGVLSAVRGEKVR